MEPRNSKASPNPCEPRRHCGQASVESRFEALHGAALTALVGREEELELLLRRWSKAKSGEGQVVLLSGEAGIGKSRLTAALLERLAGEPHTRLRYFCSPQHTDSALYPVISQMERAAGFVHDDTAQERLDKLERCWRRPRPLSRTQHCSPRCCRCRMTDDIRARTYAGAAPAENAGSARFTGGGIGTPETGADDLRGCTLDRSHKPGSVRSGRGPHPKLPVLLIVTFRPEFERRGSGGRM